MNFYFLCLVALVSILYTRETLGISEAKAMLLVIILFGAIIAYQVKFEKFTSNTFLSKSTLKKMADELKQAIYQKRDQQKTKEKLEKLMQRLK